MFSQSPGGENVPRPIDSHEDDDKQTADSTEDIQDDPSPRFALYGDALLSPAGRRRKLLAKDDYTPTVNTYHQSATPLTDGRPFPCNADNPLRALLRFSTEAIDFCTAYLATVVSNGYPLPTFISQYNYAELSSACSCFELTIGCCTLTSGNAGQTSHAGAVTTTEQGLPPVPGPQEYSGPPPTSEATITAVPQGPTSVPPPIIESTSTLYHTITLVNVPVTIASVSRAQTAGTAVSAGAAQPYAWRGGGDTLSRPVVAVVVADLSMISAYARYRQIQSLDTSAQSGQLAAPDSPPCAPEFPKNVEMTPNNESQSEILAGTASVFFSGKHENPALEAPIEMSKLDTIQCGNGASFDTHDSALGESLSEADAQKQEPPVSLSSLIIKFSTTSPGRINAVERRRSIPYPEQARSSSNQGHVLNSHQNVTCTPPAQSNKRRGRPHGSKNKTPSSKCKSRDRNTGSQLHTSTPSKVQTQHRFCEPMPKKTSLTLSEAMKASWAKRRSNGTDGHRGGPPTEKTILERNRIWNVLDKDHSTQIRQSYNDYNNPQRQLFKGQHAIRSTSGAELPKLAPTATPKLCNVQQTVPRECVNTPNVPASAQVTPPYAGLPIPGVIPTLCKDDLALMDTFTVYIYPALMKSKIRHQGSLPDETLLALCKEVANEIVDTRFQTFMRECEHHLDRRQRKRINKYIKRTYAAKVRHTQDRIQSETVLPSVDQQRQVTNVSASGTAEFLGGRYARSINQPIATGLYEKNEAVRNHEIRKQGCANSGDARPGQAETTASYSELTKEDLASGCGTILHAEATPVECKSLDNANIRSLSQAASGDKGPRKRRSKRCVPCRQSHTKCILQGRSCEACEDSGTKCFFRADDNAPKRKSKERAVSIKSGVSGQAEFRRCIRCRQKHTKCIPSSENCEACNQAGLTCSFRPADLGFNAKLSCDHWDASASLQTTFTKTVKDQQPHRHGSVPQSLHRNYSGEANPDFARPDDPPTYPLTSIALSPTVGPQPERSGSRSTAFSWQRSNRQPDCDRQGNSLQGTQISPRKLRGHVQIPRTDVLGKEDPGKDINWYKTLYPDHASQRTHNRSTHWDPWGEQSTERHSDGIQLRSPRSIKSLHKRLPTASNPALILAAINASLGESGVDRPYKSLSRGHYDFVREEYLSLLYALDSFDQAPYQIYDADTPDLRRQLKTRMGQPSEERMTAIIKTAHSMPRTKLAHRKKKNIRALLVDLTKDEIPLSAQPRLAVPIFEVKDNVLDPKHTTASLLRNREFGYESSARRIDIQNALHQRVAETMRPWRSWKGASSDVVTVAWAPDSLGYAAGAAAQSDDNDLQYNRPHNLLVGDLDMNTISELPDHRIARPRPETVKSGPNSTYAVYQACDPMVYKTVSSVHFSRWGGALYTASHDKTVKIWDTSSGVPTCSATLVHEAEVTSLELSNHYPGYFATASKCIDGPIRVYQPTQQGSQHGYINTEFSSSRALKHRSHVLYPECIRWGLTPGTKHFLLAGFQQWAEHDYSAARQGQVCLWDINTGANITVRPHASAIFSVAWHPQESIFITGGAPGGGPLSFPRRTKSVVRSYDTRNTSNYTHEFECPALDMQDVTFHPTGPNYVTAGCTNGTTYVWDYRWPDGIMHELHHGKPLQELNANEEDLPEMEHREKFDAGVMLSIWGKGASLFYTGSSDGVIKAWDILRAPEDVWVRDVAHLPAGVQSGALSPDGLNLLVGDAVGGVHVLSAAPFGFSHTGRDDNADSRDYNPDPITFVHADENEDESEVDNPGTEGIELAKQLMESGQMVLHPLFGAGKGPEYQGPLAESARWNNIVTGFRELLPQINRQQAFSVSGVEQTEFSGKIKSLVAARKEQILATKQSLTSFTIALGDPTPFVANRGTSTKPKPTSAGANVPSLKQNFALSGNPSKPSSSPLGQRASGLSASGTITPAAFSPPRPTATETIDLTDDCLISPFTGKKRRRPSTPSTPQRSTPTNASKRMKLEYLSPQRYPFTSLNSVQTSGVDIVDLTDEDASERATAAHLCSKETRHHMNARFDAMGANGRMISEKKKAAVIDLSEEEEEEEVEGNLLSWEEWVEDDYWWPKGF
ncbi:MAG: hypothetical protein Q9216_000074 [Gyalolechia sp. 2 TL-2023]